MTIADYMTAALTDPEAGYYAAGGSTGRDPLGRQGDFITAPEISQMFGELAGLWLADLWDRAGRPGHPRYVELGPGRGTLARDALRAMRQAGLEPEVHLIEGSDALRGARRWSPRARSQENAKANDTSPPHRDPPPRDCPGRRGQVQATSASEELPRGSDAAHVDPADGCNHVDGRVVVEVTVFRLASV